MVYYNDQIMDNLISAKNHLPFVHVDITLLTSQGASQITGTIGAGETRTNMNASTSMAGMLGTITNAVMRPFAYPVSPQQTETLSIKAAPALGNQAIAYTSEPMIPTKKTTETWGQEGKDPTIYTTEKTPKPVTIYKLYETFANAYLSDSSTPPDPGTYLPGTLKKRDLSQLGIKNARTGPHYYYISSDDPKKRSIINFVKNCLPRAKLARWKRRFCKLKLRPRFQQDRAAISANLLANSPYCCRAKI